MSLALSISFPAGRYHATPWGSHINEGQVEWPPSPWRILRALVASWKLKIFHDERVNALLPGIIGKLAPPPLFILPRASVGHTRHYVPVTGYREYDRTIMFDTFVALRPADEVVAAWQDVSLSEEEKSVLAKVVGQLGYLGRAESLCVASVKRDWHMERVNDSSGDPVRIMVADTSNQDPSLRWDGWAFQPDKHRPTPAWNLLATTADIRSEGWSHPPGARWITIMRPVNALHVEARPRRARKEEPGTPVAALYALKGPILPHLTETVCVAETTRRLLQGVYGRLFEGRSSPLLSGKGPNGQPLIGHRHAFYLPLDEDGDGRIEHLVVFCQGGMGWGERRAIETPAKIRGPGGCEISLVLTGLGNWNDVDKIPILAQSDQWRSVTPFIPTRNYKLRGARRDACAPEGFAALVLQEEAERRGLPEIRRITPLRRCDLWDHAWRRPPHRYLSWMSFQRERMSGKGRRGHHPGCGFQIELAQPVRGPLALGYGCHYGLGLFAPEDGRSKVSTS